MARRKLSPKDWAAVERGRPVTTYPQGGGRAQLRVATTKPQLRRRKKNNEGGTA
jgi:hypothetical protein